MGAPLGSSDGCLQGLRAELEAYPSPCTRVLPRAEQGGSRGKVRLGEGREPGQFSWCRHVPAKSWGIGDSKPGPGLGFAGYHEEIFNRVRAWNIF